MPDVWHHLDARVPMNLILLKNCTAEELHQGSRTWVSVPG